MSNPGLSEALYTPLPHPGLVGVIFTTGATLSTMIPSVLMYCICFLLKAFTKRYAMAGLRLGYGITSGETLMTQIEAQLQPWNVSTPAQEAGTAALRETAYVEKARTLIFQERQFLRTK